jgi:hypothetical protein
MHKRQSAMQLLDYILSLRRPCWSGLGARIITASSRNRRIHAVGQCDEIAHFSYLCVRGRPAPVKRVTVLLQKIDWWVRFSYPFIALIDHRKSGDTLRRFPRGLMPAKAASIAPSSSPPFTASMIVLITSGIALMLAILMAFIPFASSSGRAP